MQTVTSEPFVYDGDRKIDFPSWRGQITVGLKANNATVVRAKTPTLHPVMKPKEIKKSVCCFNPNGGKIIYKSTKTCRIHSFLPFLNSQQKSLFE